MASRHAHPVLFYDGTCGFCAGAVRFVLRHDRRHQLHFAPLQGRHAAAIRERHQEVGTDSMVWMEPDGDGEHEQVAFRSDAALRIAEYLGGVWRLALVGRVVPRRLRDAAYDFIARHRHRISDSRDFRSDVCLVPPPDVRARFLD
jgi:predicted DCC family thiol-disulfide oxidoreductase YuxK